MKSKLFSLIVSVLAAMCLWVYVMTVVNPDVDLTIGNIPVTFSGAEVLREDHGLVITGDYQEFVSVHFYGKNADLKTLDQHKDELKAVIDVSKVRSTKDYTMSYDITLPSAVSASSITKMDKSPATITFTVERQIRKSVEVRGDFSSVKIAEGYMLDSTSFDFDSITIEGPESVVNTVDHVQITIERSNVDKTITESVPVVLLDKDGAQVDPTQLTLSADAIEVTMKIVKYKVCPSRCSSPRAAARSFPIWIGITSPRPSRSPATPPYSTASTQSNLSPSICLRCRATTKRSIAPF